MGEPDKKTRDRLLDAAEELFAQAGVAETSLRDITSHADANIAAVNYYFSSKEGLIAAVYERRLKPLNDERIRLLEHATKAAGENSPTLESIMHSFFEPSVRFCSEHPDFMRIVSRLQFEPDPELRAKFIANFRDIAVLYEDALCKALPDVPLVELHWRMHFVIGSMVHTFANYRDVEMISKGACEFLGDQQMTQRLIDFAVAGLRAPHQTAQTTPQGASVQVPSVQMKEGQ